MCLEHLNLLGYSNGNGYKQLQDVPVKKGLLDIRQLLFNMDRKNETRVILDRGELNSTEWRLKLQFELCTERYKGLRVDDEIKIDTLERITESNTNLLNVMKEDATILKDGALKLLEQCKTQKEKLLFSAERIRIIKKGNEELTYTLECYSQVLENRMLWINDELQIRLDNSNFKKLSNGYEGIDGKNYLSKIETWEEVGKNLRSYLYEYDSIRILRETYSIEYYLISSILLIDLDDIIPKLNAFIRRISNSKNRLVNYKEEKLECLNEKFISCRQKIVKDNSKPHQNQPSKDIKLIMSILSAFVEHVKEKFHNLNQLANNNSPSNKYDYYVKNADKIKLEIMNLCVKGIRILKSKIIQKFAFLNELLKSLFILIYRDGSNILDTFNEKKNISVGLLRKHDIPDIKKFVQIIFKGDINEKTFPVLSDSIAFFGYHFVVKFKQIENLKNLIIFPPNGTLENGEELTGLFKTTWASFKKTKEDNVTEIDVKINCVRQCFLFYCLSPENTFFVFCIFFSMTKFLCEHDYGKDIILSLFENLELDLLKSNPLIYDRCRDILSHDVTFIKTKYSWNNVDLMMIGILNKLKRTILDEFAEPNMNQVVY